MKWGTNLWSVLALPRMEAGGNFRCEINFSFYLDFCDAPCVLAYVDSHHPENLLDGSLNRARFANSI